MVTYQHKHVLNLFEVEQKRNNTKGCLQNIVKNL